MITLGEARGEEALRADRGTSPCKLWLLVLAARPALRALCLLLSACGQAPSPPSTPAPAAAPTPDRHEDIANREASRQHTPVESRTAAAERMARTPTETDVYPELGAIILDRRTGLEWAPPSRREQTLAAAREECKVRGAPGGSPFRLPDIHELGSLLVREGEIRPFARAALPRSGVVLSDDQDWIMNLADGRVAVEGRDRSGFVFCVRKADPAGVGKRLVLGLRMRGNLSLDWAVRDARTQKQLGAGFLFEAVWTETPRLTWEVDKVTGLADVDVDPEVPWDLAVRFLDRGRQQGLVLGRIMVGAAK